MLGKTGIPPIGCREFDPNWCRLDMKCPYLKEDREDNYEQKSENTQNLGKGQPVIFNF
jgi:hypothetical protein